MKQAKLSVLMPAFNAARFIGEAIQSVLDQSFREFEFIIINDGSTDETEAVIRSFTDERILLINQENKGIAATLNRGLKLAKAAFVVRFDADDICYPHRLAKQYQFITGHTDYVVAGSSADYIAESGEYVFTNYPPGYSDEAVRKALHKACPFIHSSVIYRKDAVLQAGGYNEHAHSFEDHFLWQALLQIGKGINFQEPLIQVRLNPASITIDEQWRPKAFHQIKSKVLSENLITEAQGDSLLQIIRSQDNPPLKESAYYALLAKKYLWNNYQPQKARENLSKVLTQNRLHWISYCFYALSYLPRPILQKGYRLIKAQPDHFTLQNEASGR